MLDGIMRFAMHANWHVSLESHLVHELPWKWRGDGCITSTVHPETGNFCQSLGVPVVDISHIISAIATARVHFDNNLIGSMAADHFIERRFKHFAFYSQAGDPVADDRYRGFSERLDRVDAEIQRIDFPAGLGGKINKYDNWQGRRQRLLEQLKHISTPLALFCNGDRIALGAVEACQYADIRVPEDIAILGVGNFHLVCEASPIPLSSIKINAEEMGYEAASMLQLLMDGQPTPGSPMLLQPKGIAERRSTATFVGDNPEISRAVQYIQDHFSEPVSVDDIARATGLSRRRLYYLFNQHVHELPGHLLEELRIKRSIQLLEKTDLKVSSIATECGYRNRASFHRAFKRQHKTSPAMYRKLIGTDTLSN